MNVSVLLVSLSVLAIILGFLAAVIGASVAALLYLGLRRQRVEIRDFATRFVLKGPENTLRLVEQLKPEQVDNVKGALAAAVQDVADILMLSPKLVRANLFGLDADGRLKMLPPFNVGEYSDQERTISMPIGTGSTGIAFQTGKPNIAIYRDDWGKHAIEDQELRKAHPDLSWIISIPLLTGTDPPRSFWVFNVDGLRERKTEAELQMALGPLLNWSYLITALAGADLLK